MSGTLGRGKVQGGHSNLLLFRCLIQLLKRFLGRQPLGRQSVGEDDHFQVEMAVFDGKKDPKIPELF